MSTVPRRATSKAEANGRTLTSSISTGSKKLPNRILLYAREGWGKTSFAAHSHKPLFLLTRGEDGLEKLIETGEVAPTAHFDEQLKTWPALLRALDELIESEHEHQTLVIDTINGALSSLLRLTVAEDFAGNESKAAQFGGVELAKLAAVRLSAQLLTRLDALRATRKMTILLLAHAEVAKVTNPAGPDFDRYQPSIERKHLWPELARWLDIILFGDYDLVAEKNKGERGKASGGTQRIIRTEAEAWYDAKNRHGFHNEIEGGSCAAEAWESFKAALEK